MEVENLTICYGGKWYNLEQTEPVKGLLALLSGDLDPKEWRNLMQKATPIEFNDEHCPHLPTDELIEALRKLVVSDDAAMQFWAEDMTREDLTYEPLREELVPEMIEILEDPVKFLKFCREDAVQKVEIEGNGGWRWLCHDLVYDLRFDFFLTFLEHGFFVFCYTSDFPLEDDLYGYIINLDIGMCLTSGYGECGPRVFEMQSLPWNWRSLGMIPRGWVEIAYAYTPTVKDKVLAMIENNHETWGLVLDKAAAPACPDFLHCMAVLELVQDFLGGERTWGGRMRCAYHQAIYTLLDLSWMERRDPVDEEVEEVKHSGLQALKMALKVFDESIRLPFNENTLTLEAFRYLTDVANNEEILKQYAEQIFPLSTTVPKDDVVDFVRELCRVKQREKFMNT